MTHWRFERAYEITSRNCAVRHTAGSVYSMASWINSARLATPSFNIIRARYVSTVLRESESSGAMAELDDPAMM